MIWFKKKPKVESPVVVDNAWRTKLYEDQKQLEIKHGTEQGEFQKTVKEKIKQYKTYYYLGEKVTTTGYGMSGYFGYWTAGVWVAWMSPQKEVKTRFIRYWETDLLTEIPPICYN